MIGKFKCPKCGHRENKTTSSSRYEPERNIYIRRRRCDNCEHVFVTYEVMAKSYDSAIMVAKGIRNIMQEMYEDEEDETTYSSE